MSSRLKVAIAEYNKQLDPTTPGRAELIDWIVQSAEAVRELLRSDMDERWSTHTLLIKHDRLHVSSPFRVQYVSYHDALSVGLWTLRLTVLRSDLDDMLLDDLFKVKEALLFLLHP